MSSSASLSDTTLVPQGRLASNQLHFINDSKNFLDEVIHAAEKIKWPLIERHEQFSFEGNGKKYKKIVHINSDFSRVDYVPGLKTTLLAHQKPIVRAMFDVEQKRAIDLTIVGSKNRVFSYADDGRSRRASREKSEPARTGMLNQIAGRATTVAADDKYRLRYCAAVLSDPPGSGKTIDILSLILLSPVPRIVPDIFTFVHRMPLSTKGNDSAEADEEILVMRRKFPQIFRQTLIFVGASVLNQWILAIKRFTDLNAFAVKDVYDVRDLLQMIHNKVHFNHSALDAYDIIIVKNGKITVDLGLPEVLDTETNEEKANPNAHQKRGASSIYNIIGSMGEFCWARVVIDDFDTIHLPSPAKIVPAIFTWFVSATNKLSRRSANVGERYYDESSIFHGRQMNYEELTNEGNLFYLFNVSNDATFLKNSAKIPIPKYFVHVICNKNDKLVDALRISGAASSDVVEALNADAFNEAAQKIGIACDNVAGVFEQILGRQFNNYKTATELLIFIDDVLAGYELLPPISQHLDPDNAKYGKKELLERAPVEYKYPGLRKLLDESRAEYLQIKNDAGRAIQRIKDRITDGECSICCNPLAGKSCTINKCCSFVLCSGCGIQTQIDLPQGHDGRPQTAESIRQAAGRCANCRAAIKMADLVYLDDKFELSQIVGDNLRYEQKTELKSQETKTDETAEAKTKWEVIRRIIMRKKIAQTKQVDMHIPNILKGTHRMPDAPICKALIFANFEEPLQNVTKLLVDAKIKHWRLGGTAAHINEMAEEFTKCGKTCALIINSVRYSSGLNLQTATDVIFVHQITDAAWEIQVTGRALRIGRTNNLNIHYVLYENEYAHLCVTHNVRVMDDKEIAELNACDTTNKPAKKKKRAVVKQIDDDDE